MFDSIIFFNILPNIEFQLDVASMFYILNGDVKFKPEDGMIWKEKNSGADDPLTLTLTECRLLEFLIKEKGRVVSRNEIFEEVWEKWGLEGSNNSLNHFISRLRKVLAACELPDGCIQTIPRIGFMLTDEINIKMVEEAQPKASEMSPSPGETEILSRSKLKIWLIPAFTAILSLAVVALRNEDPVPIRTALIGHILNCDVKSLTPSLDISKQSLLKNTEMMAAAVGLNCNLPGTIFVFLDKKSIFSERGVIFLSHCTGKENEITDCSNFMDGNWNGVQ
ncbi:winged helix-turn-helix domain-containing protein [Enterobacter sp. Cy-643]|uniref:winged helix-turn-helix domain-containing protein n=1 Tax=Enterobacter sp. Cy-643 TaxID=2608346 RepID=UPI00141FB542|nr:winged helix-turn-helix domain-containing protein [Enterobacter sp. Cy-643]